MIKPLLSLILAFATLSCSSQSTDATPPTAAAKAVVPITSKSPQAVEHFRRGLSLVENVRNAEAAEELQQAIAADHDFAAAHAVLGWITPTDEGLQHVAQALELSSGLDRAERAEIEALAALRRGNQASAETLLQEVVSLAPDDWHARVILGQTLTFAEKFPAAAAELQKAADLDPAATPAWNELGYTYLRQYDFDRAVAAFQKYAAATPQEPNPQDSLGEALLAAGRFEEAEAAYRRATELSPRFWNAWEGMAYTKFYRGDWAGGRQALSRAREAAPRTNDKVAVDSLLAWATLAEGNIAGALKQFEAVEQTPGAELSDLGSVPVYRALALVEAKRYSDARAHLEAALQRTASLPEGLSRAMEGSLLEARAALAGRSSNAEELQRTIGALTEASKKPSPPPTVTSGLHFAQGMEAYARHNLDGARAHWAQCLRQDTYCQWHRALDAKLEFDRASIGASKADVARAYLRDPISMYFRARLDKHTPS